MTKTADNKRFKEGEKMMKESLMRLGFALPQINANAGPDALTRVAQRAEELGHDSLWVLDRILFPVNPRAPCGDGTLPDSYKRVLDPLETLTFVAAHTRRIALGTSVLKSYVATAE